MSHRALQEECYEANIRLPKLGLVDLTFGNVSVIDRASGIFAIKPSGVDYDTLKPEDIVLLDLEGNKIASEMRPSSDTPTHRHLFLAFPQIGAVVHTHSRKAVAFAQAGQAIPCLGTTHADYFYGEVPVTRPMTAPEIASNYEWETGKVIAERFQSLDPEAMSAVLVHGHGPFVWGANAAKAVENALALEIVADLAMMTLCINPDSSGISTELLDKHFLRKHGASAYYGQQ